MSLDRLQEECAVVGVTGHPEAANLIYLALYALQHRGQEASGIVVEENGEFRIHKAFGLVSDVFSHDVITSLHGSRGVGHNRYSTTGGSRTPQNIQPFTFNSQLGPIAVAHNGNLTNAAELRKAMERQGAIYQSTSDTEVFMHLLARCDAPDLRTRVQTVMAQVRGAYSLVLLAGDNLIAVRDPFGFRPLVIGRKGKAVIIASETCALDLISATFEREVHPGEVVEVDKDGQIRSSYLERKEPRAFCSFEPIYFARPDSKIFGQEIYGLRKRIGEVLAREAPVAADVVIAVPDSGVPMAIGYGKAAGLPMELGLIRNHYVGRTFIEPSQSIRDFGVKLKLNPVESVLRDQRVVVVDDSIVRGTTSAKIVRMLRQAGAKEVHMRVGSPPITHSCYFGVDTPDRSGLLAAQQTIEEIRAKLGADSLAFLSQDGLRAALGESEGHRTYCLGCFTGKYPEHTGTQIKDAPTDRLGGPGLVSFGSPGLLS